MIGTLLLVAFYGYVAWKSMRAGVFILFLVLHVLESGVHLTASALLGLPR